MKTCRTCGQEKPLEAFHQHKLMADGRCLHCADCINKKYRERYADPNYAPKKRSKPSPLIGTGRPLEERFWAKVNKDGPIHPVHGQCWVWTGSINARGYPQLWNGNSPNGHPFADVAHRISYQLHKGPIPDGYFIDHICQNKPCVRPEHLRAVTPTVSALENNESPFAKNARRTACPAGHPYTPENLMSGTRGRMCRACYLARCTFPEKSKHFRA